MPITDTEIAMIGERVRTATSVAAQRGYQPPTDYVTWQKVAAEAARVRDEPPPAVPAPPSDPKTVGAWCDEFAAALIAHRERKAVAGELFDRCNRTAMRAIVESVPDWVGMVCVEFDSEVEEFARLVGTAPHAVNGSTTPEEFALHRQLLRATESLTQAALARGQLALVNDEGEHIGKDGALWLLLEPKPEATLFGVNQLLKDIAGFPVDIEQWSRCNEVGMRMARPNEVGPRRERFAMLLNANGMSPSGGMTDVSFDKATEMAATASGRRVSAARAGQI